MKTIKYIVTSLLIIGLAGFAYAGKVNKDSSWEEILADDTLRVVFPTISVGNGKFVTYDHLFLDNDQLTTGKTFEDAVAYENNLSEKLIDNDRSPAVIKTAIRQEVAALNYTTEKCDLSVTSFNKDDDDYAGPLVCYPVEGEHKTMVQVSVYKKALNTNNTDRENRNDDDSLLFTKEYTVPVYTVEEVNS